ncbi:MAG: glycosyltransferase family 4 protein, partial [Actinomycetota bacterium]|nr:glycosyltransferase family 4 protein [Actinomycetota bacterium]
LTTLKSLATTVANGRFDVIHAQHSYCMHQLRAVGQWIPRETKIVFTCHEGEASAARDLGRGPHDRGLLKKLAYWATLKKVALSYADAVVFVDDSIARALSYNGSYEVIPPGVDLQRFTPIDKAEARRNLDLADDRPIVLFPADPAHKPFVKGYDLFQQSLELLQRSPQVIVGGGIDHESMPLYMNAADVVVQTSRFEGSPSVIKEAMACERPIVSTPVGDVERLIEGLPGH